MKPIPLGLYQTNGSCYIKTVTITNPASLEVTTGAQTYTYGALTATERFIAGRPSASSNRLALAAFALRDAINASPDTFGITHRARCQNPEVFAHAYENMVFVFGRVPNHDFTLSATGASVGTFYTPSVFYDPTADGEGSGEAYKPLPAIIATPFDEFNPEATGMSYASNLVDIDLNALSHRGQFVLELVADITGEGVGPIDVSFAWSSSSSRDDTWLASQLDSNERTFMVESANGWQVNERIGPYELLQAGRYLYVGAKTAIDSVGSITVNLIAV